MGFGVVDVCWLVLLGAIINSVSEKYWPSTPNQNKSPAPNPIAKYPDKVAGSELSRGPEMV